jgi:heme/copper-type cytochrome/quinol oxidase subunit 1
MRYEPNKLTATLRATLPSLRALSGGLMLVKYALALGVVVAVAALFGALSTAAGGGFGLHFVAWLFGLGAGFGSALFGLRSLRRRRFGDAPPRTPVSPLDLMLGVGGIITGVGLLFLFAPDLARANGGHTTTAALGAALGAFAIVKAAYSAFRYVSDR